MGDTLLRRDLFKNYAKYCLPVLFFVLILLIVLFISFNNLSTTVINSTNASTDIQKMSEIKFSFVGVQLLDFVTFVLACVVPIVVALLMGTYEKNGKNNPKELSVEEEHLFSSKVISGTLFVILPFLANVLMYGILIVSGFFGSFESNILLRLVLMTIFGFALGMLTFILITTINLALKNPVIDSLLTLAIALFVTHVFYHSPVNVIFLIVIIFFVWLALLYLGYSMSKKKEE